MVIKPRQNSIVQVLIGMFVLGVCLPVQAWAQQSQNDNLKAAKVTVTRSVVAEKASTVPVESMTDAEKITRLQELIEENEKLLKEFQNKIENPSSEYGQAESEFKVLDDKLETAKHELQKARQEGRSADVERLKPEMADLEKQWKLARDRFDLAIQERKTLQEQLVNLQQKMSQDRQALQRLLTPRKTTSPADQPLSSPATQPAPPAETVGEVVDKQAPPPTVPPASGLVGVGVPKTEQPPTAPAQPAEATEPPPQEWVEAREELEAKTAEVQQAKEEARSVTERINQIEQAIESQQKMVETARKKSTNAQETESSLTEQLQRLSTEGASQDKIQALWLKIRQARQRYRDAQQELTQQDAQLDSLRVQLAELQAEQIAAMKEVVAKREAEQKAQEKIKRIENPFSPQNLLRWLAEKGPPLLGVTISVFLLLSLERFLRNRFIDIIARRTERGTPFDREKRAKTLADVVHNTARIVIVVGGIFMLMDVINVPLAPLMGGAAVVGLAVAFGAQNLIRDYFSGFIILLENQYGINDVVKICGVAGLVERITLRITVLRDLEGVAHFIPNGQITSVSNLTHGWSRVVFDIGVAYKEDVDHVMKVLMEVCAEVRKDPEIARLIIDEPEMLGVDAFGDSAVVIKFLIKTKPLQQWTVKRAVLRRIKKRFDELGIEIPFPHRTVFHRTESGEPPSDLSPLD